MSPLAASRPARWNETSWPDHYGPLNRAFVDSTFRGANFTLHEWAAPLWLVALVPGAWPGASVARAVRRAVVRRRALRTGCCPNCGYDLRGTPTPPADGGAILMVCPECGNGADRGG